jgi:hypothetical protein
VEVTSQPPQPHWCTAASGLFSRRDGCKGQQYNQGGEMLYSKHRGAHILAADPHQTRPDQIHTEQWARGGSFIRQASLAEVAQVGHEDRNMQDGRIAYALLKRTG